MNTKRLITASIFSLISASTALAADVMIPHQPASSTSSTIVAPTFSWTGLYLGVQAGGFSSKADMALVDQKKSFPLDKEFSPKLSGFVGGFYAGSNIDLGDNFIFGVDTDLMISGKKHTKTIPIGAVDNTTVENAVVRSRRSTEVTQSTVSTEGTPTGTQAQAVSGTPTGTQGAQAAASGTGAGAGTTPQAAASGQSATQSSQVQSQVTNRGTSSSTAQVQTPSVSAGPSSTAASAESGRQQVSSDQSAGSRTGGGSAAKGTPVPTSKVTLSSAGTGVQSQSLLRSDTGSVPVTVVNGSNQASPKPASSSAGAGAAGHSSLLLARSDEGDQSSGGGAKATASTSQPSATDRTVPSGGRLVLARSGSSNGTSGAQSGGHHSASHSGGHGSGAHAHGAHPHASRPHGAQSTQAADKGNSSVYGIEQMKRMASELGLDQEDEVETLSHTFKQNWSGATRVRIGFAVDRFMPYLAGGIAYGQFHDTISISVKDEDGRVVSSKNLADETKTMIGYTLGGGVDFSLLDNVIVRAEYRYSDFGKKKFAKEKLEISYKTNDFRVGVAYKF
ncbi:outer membrane beta-barrel protein [Bartonella grahamii]|uniref:outer membrane beta-barrel protein n=1 Tax=Bartonella grahamii TaxID=33045 RepID=UPI002E7AF12A|nr:outer membrane beta-barrel protein [Bartonella grahamii]